MIKVEDIEVVGINRAMTAMRNPMNSWSKSDSLPYAVGDADIELANKLFNAGVEHRTYARMIFCYMEVTAPLYWWKEMDRYRMGKEQISTSTMHKILDKPFSFGDFSHDHLCCDGEEVLSYIIEALNESRGVYENFDELKEDGCLIDGLTKKDVWWNIIQLLPSSYNQKRTLCLSYECCMKIIKERKSHKLDEWIEFVRILKGLPYMDEFTNGVKDDD